MATPTTSAWDSVNNPKSNFSSALYGKVDLRAETVGLVKGVGKQPFDPMVHKKAFTSIDCYIDPLPEMEITNNNVCLRNMLAESTEWRDITLKSLHDLNVQDVRDVIGRWAKVEPVPTGDTYTNSNGQIKERTTFKFVVLFKTEAECRSAYLDDHDPFADAPAPTQPAPTPTAAAAQPGAGRDTAMKFLPVIVNNAWIKANKDFDAAKTLVAQMINQYPAIAPYFSSESPEVADLLMQQALKV